MKTRKEKVARLLICVCSIIAIGSLTALAAEIPDDLITFWVKEALREDVRVKAADVTVTTDKGIITLAGTVLNLAEKNYALRQAKKIKGVRGVIDEIVVKPSYRPDTDIRQDILRRLLNSAFINFQGIWVKVANGEVTLTGRVSSWTQKQHAELLASEVRGVRAVHNELNIKYSLNRSDDAVKKDIIDSLTHDVYLTGIPIEVTVDDGIVTLKGNVGNAYEKEQAWNDAWVWGAIDVKNNIKVEWWKDEGVREAIPFPDDQQLKQAVHDELNQDLRIEDPLDVKVEASYGHVTLRGIVPTFYQKRLAGRDTLNVVGVVWVSNLLMVSPVRRDDWEILGDIQFEIDSDYALNGENIKVKVKDGVVTLSGDVNTSYEKIHAADVASYVLGVRDVVNNLTVNRQPQYTDAALKERIKSRLSSNAETARVADQITVKVDHGKATLTGTVDNWAELHEAGQVAFLTDGIWAVDNQLTIKNVNYPWDEWHSIGPGISMYDPHHSYGYDHYFHEVPFP